MYVRAKILLLNIVLKYYVLYLQFTIFLTSKCTKDLIIKVFSVTFGFISFTVMYKSFYDNSKTVSWISIFNYIAIHIWMKAYIIKNHTDIFSTWDEKR